MSSLLRSSVASKHKKPPPKVTAKVRAINSQYHLTFMNNLKNSFGYYINKLDNMKKLDRSTILVILSILVGVIWMLGF